MTKKELIEALANEAGLTRSTGESIKVKPKKLPFFKYGKELKETVDTYRKSKRRR